MQRSTATAILLLIAAVSVWFAMQASMPVNALSASGKPLPLSQPQTSRAVAYSLSRPLRDAVSQKPKTRFADNVLEIGGGITVFDRVEGSLETVRSKSPTEISMPPPLVSFDGLTNFDNIAAYSAVVLPPDANGDIGPDHFVQVANLLIRVFNKSGDPLSPPIKTGTIFRDLNTPCAAQDDGLPIVLYDPLADRWLVSQYCYLQPPFRQMIAISETGDPLGRYHAYEFVMPNVRINDLAKFAIWHDAIYMTTEEYLGSDYRGSGVFAFDREAMLRGDSDPAYVYVGFRSPSGIPRNLMPVDLDGIAPPSADNAGLIAGYSATEYGDPADAIRLFEFRANFSEPLLSTFTEHETSPFAVESFDPTSPPGRTDIIQPPPGAPLDSNSDRLANRAAYRSFEGHESIVISHTIALSQFPYRAAQRVYELRRASAAPMGSFAVEQQLTLGDETKSRWIGSAAMDGSGNIAFSYNIGSDTQPPSVFYSGRAAADPPGSVRLERPLVTGTGVQRAFGFRWGDYSSMSVDPVDDCTFWTNGQYYTLDSQKFSEFTWLTRIGSFRFDECVASPRARISGTVRNAATGELIDGADIVVGPYTRRSKNGAFGPVLTLPGQYDITVDKRGFFGYRSIGNVSNGSNVSLNVNLEPAPVIETESLTITQEACGINGVPDPGEHVTVRLALTNRGQLSAENVVVELLPTAQILPTSPPQNFGDLVAGGSAATREFSFTVSPTTSCGAAIELRFAVAPAGLRPTVVSVMLRAGKERIAFTEGFDRVQTAGLPTRWTRSNQIPELFWSVSTARKTSGLKSMFSTDPIRPGVNEIVSPAIPIRSTIAKLSFQNWYELETTFLRNRLYDGSVLEVSLDGGAWQDIIDAGGVFESGGYDGEIDGCCQNPLAGRQGWSGRSGIEQTSVFITTAVVLPPSFSGSNVRFRWRVGTDIGGFREGQYIDDVKVTDGYECSCQTSN